MILPLLGTIAKGAIKGMVGRRRRKKGEGAQVSSSIVKVNKNKGDKTNYFRRGKPRQWLILTYPPLVPTP